MSYRMKMMVPILGMFLVFGFAAIKVAGTNADEVELPLPSTLSDLATAKLIEVKDGAGQVVLSGNFTASAHKAGEIERTATLVATGVDADATGVAEIEISNEADGFTEQELEVTVKRLAALTAFKIFVDGNEVAPFTTSARGHAEIEISNERSR